MIDAVVIGAGQAGLATSHHLALRGVEHVVLERGRVGDTWRSQRWDSFVLNTPNHMNRLPGETSDSQPADGFAALDAHVARLQAYADSQGCPVQLGATVTAIDMAREGHAFVATIVDASGERTLETRSVVVASGFQNVARVPPISRMFPVALHQRHGADYRNPADLPPGAVLVVGSAQSGMQVVEDLLDAERAVFLCTSGVARLRRRYRGRDTFEWLIDEGFFDQRLDRLPDPRLRFVAQPAISGGGRFGHTVSLQYLAAHGATLLGRPTAIEGGRLQLEDTLGSNIALGDRTSAEFNARIEKWINKEGLSAAPIEPDPADQPHPNPMAVRSPASVDLEAAGIASVIWATGFTGDLGYLHPLVVDDVGMPSHDRGIAPVAGIYFVGFPWLSKKKSGIIFGVDEDAAFVADRLVERLTSE